MNWYDNCRMTELNRRIMINVLNDIPFGEWGLKEFIMAARLEAYYRGKK